jgi:hypothetical protein
MNTANEQSKKLKKSATTIVIVSKTGTLTEVVVEPENETTLDELTILLSKKCGYRNHNGFSCYHTYKYKNKKKFSFYVDNEDVIPKYIYVDVWAKTDGRAGNENKYEMPPPVDEIIYYGNIALVARIDKEHAVNLTATIWNVIYERLFGGFEDLASTAVEDENEIDELDLIPAYQKTINGYLKDGFVVDDDSDDKTPRCHTSRKSKKSRGKKNKSESTESEFVTETETESETPPSDSPNDSDVDADADNVEVETTSKKKIKKENQKTSTKKPIGTIKKSASASASASGSSHTAVSSSKSKKTKKSLDEHTTEQENEKELSEEEYI